MMIACFWMGRLAQGLGVRDTMWRHVCTAFSSADTKQLSTTSALKPVQLPGTAPLSTLRPCIFHMFPT